MLGADSDGAGGDGAGAPTPGAAPRLRIHYSKLGRVRFTSHRDVVRMWERALGRSRLPVGWSEGFSPRPLVSFGLALPTGAESVAEYLDLVLRPEATLVAGPPVTADGSVTADGHVPAGGHVPADGDGGVAALLSACLPDGVDVCAALLVPSGSGSLQQEVSSCSWKLEVLGVGPEELGSRVERLLAAASVPIERERKGRAVRDDLRPAVRSLAVTDAPRAPGATGVLDRPGVWLDAELATRPRGVRPRELLEGLGADLRLARARRMHQWIERDGARWEPLQSCGSATGPVRAHAGGQAS